MIRVYVVFRGPPLNPKTLNPKTEEPWLKLSTASLLSPLSARLQNEAAVGLGGLGLRGLGCRVWGLGFRV